MAIFPVKLKTVLSWAAAATCVLSAPYAAQSAPSKSEPALAFDLTARVSYKVPGETPLPPQIIKAKVLVSGEKARIETALGGQPSIFLFAPPFTYRLLPSSKAGVRYKISPRSSGGSSLSNYRELLHSPTKLRAALLQSGARKVGEGKQAGVLMEKFEVKDFRGEKGQNAKVWLRKSDSLPARLEISGSNLLINASWSNYSHPSKISSTSFAPPPGYKIRNSQSSAPSPQL